MCSSDLFPSHDKRVGELTAELDALDSRVSALEAAGTAMNHKKVIRRIETW